MNSEIIFNKDLDSASAYISKIYEADVTTVWDYFTKSELLDQWWAPKPWKCETQKLDFRENGTWHYAMVGPDGEKIYSIVKFGEIMEHRSFDGEDAFSDDKGRIGENFPETKWLYGFTGIEEGTKLTVNLTFYSKDKMKEHLEMGFEDGFKTGLNQLEDLLSKN
ncbi:SRPBCC domain-containing protein [Epilithonimonas sp. JDS]|uniref:SRPBCC family protein n=1 Tax=Epilithonimonas sp. JDS TaxID=2902797 RepID=UPI001E39A2BE|nr:SRPBCC domain-containing protein [Epilithonimonas sp. JDS]MCD9854264.1 SRPBCC domain-containing protein [Epilithonimonas sp. JDS]